MPAKHLSYSYVEPEAVALPPLEIELLAERCARDWGFRDGVLFDTVCKDAGVDIEYSRRPNEIMLDVPLKGRPIIWLPKVGRKRDDRVILATALGHWALHVEPTRKAKPGCGVQALYDPTSNAARAQAAVFGLAFLMPTDEFVKAWHPGRSQAISDYFDVPTKTAYLRATSLELHHVT